MLLPHAALLPLHILPSSV